MAKTRKKDDRNKYGLNAEERKWARSLAKAPASELKKTLGFDSVTKPKHYNLGKVECIDALEAATITLTGIEAVCTANAIKYLWRWKQKNGAEDLKKAKWYIDRMLTLMERHE